MSALMEFIFKSWETTRSSGLINATEKNKRGGVSSVEACGAFISLLTDKSGHCGVIWECWAPLEELSIKDIVGPEQLEQLVKLWELGSH